MVITLPCPGSSAIWSSAVSFRAAGCGLSTN